MKTDTELDRLAREYADVWATLGLKPLVFDAFLAGAAVYRDKLAIAEKALEKIAEADCPSYMAHPQSVWFDAHVVKLAREALAEIRGGG